MQILVQRVEEWLAVKRMGEREEEEVAPRVESWRFARANQSLRLRIESLALVRLG